jgi:two-component system, cell cycle response regulator
MKPVRQPRILVAEDDRVLQDLVAELLVEAGYDVTTASDGDEALKIVREQSPDLVLLDVMMPRMDGYAVCREIRAAGPAAPPVIFVTAHGNIKDRVTGLDLGAVDYLVKPFNPPELEARVRAALRTKAALDALAADGATDALTGFLSRGQVAGRTEGAVALARRHRRPLSCLILAVEDVAEVVERHGAGAGDVLLREVARRLREITRRSDVVARYGEAAVLLLLPETDEDGAFAAAERLRVGLEGIPVPLPGFCPPLRVSAGVAALTPDLQDGPALLRAAAQALARAQEMGPARALRAT